MGEKKSKAPSCEKGAPSDESETLLGHTGKIKPLSPLLLHLEGFRVLSKVVESFSSITDWQHSFAKNLLHLVFSNRPIQIVVSLKLKLTRNRLLINENEFYFARNQSPPTTTADKSSQFHHEYRK